MRAEVTRALDAVRQAEWTLRGVDSALRASQLALPPRDACEVVAKALLSVASMIEEAAWLEPRGGAELTDAFQRHLGVWLYRSRLFARSHQRTHAALPDPLLLEWIYELETASGQDPDQPGIVNCLDYAFARMQGTRGVWHQRRRLAQVVRGELIRRPGSVSVLHVAGGGARYLADLVERAEGGRLHLTCVYEDAATLRLLEGRFGGGRVAGLTTIHGGVRGLAELAPARYDVILAPGALDSLADPEARELLRALVGRLDAGAVLALSSPHPGDRSACLRRLVTGWSPIARSERGLLALAPRYARVHTERSSEGSLAYLIGRGPE